MNKRTKALVMVLPLVIALGLLILGVGYVDALPDSYNSRVSVAFDPKLLKTGGIAGSESVVLAASNYVSVVDSDETVATVAEQAGVGADTLDDATLSTIIPGTATMSIEVELEDAETAAVAANAYAKILLGEVESSEVVVARISGKAAVSEQPSGPPRTILLAMTGFLALVLGSVVLIALVFLFRMSHRGGFGEAVDRFVVGTPGAKVDSGTGASPNSDPTANPDTDNSQTGFESRGTPTAGQVQ